eukprot:213320-Rhodomonas_salina.1
MSHPQRESHSEACLDEQQGEFPHTETTPSKVLNKRRLTAPAHDGTERVVGTVHSSPSANKIQIRDAHSESEATHTPSPSSASPAAQSSTSHESVHSQSPPDQVQSAASTPLGPPASAVGTVQQIRTATATAVQRVARGEASGQDRIYVGGRDNGYIYDALVEIGHVLGFTSCRDGKRKKDEVKSSVIRVL